MDDESSAVFADYANADPALPLDKFGSSDVMHVLPAVGAVMCTFVIEADHRLVVPHVYERQIRPIAYLDLCSRGWQPGVDKDQAQPRFLRRLRGCTAL